MDILPTTQDINDFTNKIWHCQAEELLAALPSDSVDMILTSPPYDNLREYSLEKFVVWRYNITQEDKQRVINELKKRGVKPIPASK